MPGFRVGVDIGGTFTDIVFLGQDGAIHTKKVSSSVDNYARAIIDGISQVFQNIDRDGASVEEVLHATTMQYVQFHLQIAGLASTIRVGS
jgi:N-methylhydantoinase A